MPQSSPCFSGRWSLPLGARKTLAGTPTYFVGYLTGKELGAAFASADAFIFRGRETLGLVLLEAMAAGCPVVAASSGGILILWLTG